jgi:hypothetical protein
MVNNNVVRRRRLSSSTTARRPATRAFATSSTAVRLRRQRTERARILFRRRLDFERPSPPFPAEDFTNGTVLVGNDGRQWVSEWNYLEHPTWFRWCPVQARNLRIDDDERDYRFEDMLMELADEGTRENYESLDAGEQRLFRQRWSPTDSRMLPRTSRYRSCSASSSSPSPK